ncbi:MAG: UDP-N-acetylglucosamine 2-epimerase [Patescibacteria group bacterium]|nr:UDP-N-acetylglucosamine 2-epimerase [Patescibacteria group bacterium]MDD5715138.1 UDP-N-acetylglucosamine 2-epimerase [Patescibacteria group bacterium]
MTNKKRKIAYITGTRADFGLMTSVLSAIQQSKKLELQIYITGMHLMKQFGNTISEVKKEFPLAKKINATFQKDNLTSMAQFTGQFLQKLIKLFIADKPDFVLTLGDRAEMICTALACSYLNIPTGQLHGGEKSSTVDETVRHAITKLSHLHFPATRVSAKRIEQMGEEKWRIHVVGAPALDVILNQKLPTRKELFEKLKINTNQKIILVTQHPVSGEWHRSTQQMKETLKAVKFLQLPVIVTFPNADAGGRAMIKEIRKEGKNPLFHIFPNIEYKYFLALEREVSVWVGNSSGAMIESSAFHLPVVNIGTRQFGRQRGANVIDVGYLRKEITKAINKSLNDKVYLEKIAKSKSPWGDGKTSQRVVKILEKLHIDSKLVNKQLTYV